MDFHETAYLSRTEGDLPAIRYLCAHALALGRIGPGFREGTNEISHEAKVSSCHKRKKKGTYNRLSWVGE